MFDLKIANGNIVTENAVCQGDILVRNGKIALLGDAGGIAARETLDASGKYVFPGMLDSHAHLNDPGFTWREDFQHGSAAAVAGGVTVIIDMPLQNEPALTDAGIFAAKQKAIEGRSVADYAFWGGLVPGNVDKLAEMWASGVVAFKAFIGPVSPDYAPVSMGLVRRAMLETRKFDGLLGFHCEDFSIIKESEAEVEARVGDQADWSDFLASRPVSAELISTYSIIALARETGARVHICHVSHPEVAELIRLAKRDSVRVTGETCAHYLVFSDADVLRNGSIFKCAPPLRSPEARERLWDYVVDGTLSCLGSDHSPCRADEKNEKTHGIFGAWGGISGIQSLMQTMFSEGVVKRGFSPTFIAASSAATAKAFSLDHVKGALRPGLDADLVILDPDREWTITSQSLHYLNQISAFVGLKGKGLPVTTLVRGVIVARDGEVVGRYGHGKLLKNSQTAIA